MRSFDLVDTILFVTVLRAWRWHEWPDELLGQRPVISYLSSATVAPSVVSSRRARS